MQVGQVGFRWDMWDGQGAGGTVTGGDACEAGGMGGHACAIQCVVGGQKVAVGGCG
jgi:hypothetical protein